MIEIAETSMLIIFFWSVDCKSKSYFLNAISDSNLLRNYLLCLDIIILTNNISICLKQEQMTISNTVTKYSIGSFGTIHDVPGDGNYYL